jgi:Uma2 family endonuclease
MTTTFLPLLTLADLEAMPDDDNKYELIEGELFVSRAPHFNHNSAILNLALQLKNYLSRNPIGKVFVEPSVIFGDYDAVIPDLVYFSNERFEAHAREEKFYAAPDLVVEIASPGVENERRDWHIKRRLYAQQGAQKHWIVDWQKRRIAVHRLRENELVLVEDLSGTDDLTTPLLPGFSCKVEQIFEI